MRRLTGPVWRKGLTKLEGFHKMKVPTTLGEAVTTAYVISSEGSIPAQEHERNRV